MRKSGLHRFLGVPAALLLLFATALHPSAYGQSAAPAYELTILATNDLHGCIDSLPQYLTIINQVRAQKENVLLLDGGDVFRRGPYEALQGSVEIELLNQMGYDAMVLGNNEFKVPSSPDSKDGSGTLEESDAQIAQIVQWADFPVLCGNVTMKGSGAYMDGVKPYTVVAAGDLKIGIIGVTHTQPEQRKLEMAADKDFVRGDKAVRALLPAVREESDIQIVLSHAGLFVDLNMRGVSAVIGAHHHLRLPRLKNWHRVPVTQGGGQEKHRLVQLTLCYALKNGKWTLQSFSSKLHKADGWDKDPLLVIPPAPQQVLNTLSNNQTFTSIRRKYHGI